MSENGKGFHSLVRQVALIGSTATVLLCLIREISLLDTLFRTGVVYISVGILGYVVSNQLARLTLSPAENPHSIDTDVVETDETALTTKGNR